MTDFDVAATGVMHTPSDLISDALSIVRRSHPGPFMAYPDSGYFRMPHWQFEDVITPQRLREFATRWVEAGVQIIGGCCGLSPGHIEALASLQ
jgi:S-methylmethionine-dependent homocysteine/selenocysteine methylase